MKNLIVLCAILVFSQSYIPVIAQSTIPDTIIINQITITNPDKIALVKNENNLLIFDSPDFQIVYIKDSNNEFLIDIRSADFEVTKIEAEKKLLEILNVTESDSCWLFVIITSSKREDTSNWGKNYEPSFCTQHQSRRLRDKSTDVNLDGTTNTLDYVLVLNIYGKSDVDISEDINGDMKVDSRDLSLVLKNLGRSTHTQL